MKSLSVGDFRAVYHTPSAAAAPAAAAMLAMANAEDENEETGRVTFFFSKVTRTKRYFNDRCLFFRSQNAAHPSPRRLPSFPFPNPKAAYPRATETHGTPRPTPPSPGRPCFGAVRICLKKTESLLYLEKACWKECRAAH